MALAAGGPSCARCCGLTRAGQRCSIRSDCKLVDGLGRPVGRPLQRGGAYCLFHLSTLSVQPAAAASEVCLFYLDLETTGLDLGSDEIVEIGVISDACGAVYSTVVRPATGPQLLRNEGLSIHGISDAELQEGPAFCDAFGRLVRFVDDITTCSILKDSAGDSDDDDKQRARAGAAAMLADPTPTPLIVAHNGRRFDFPMLLSQCLRSGVSCSPLSRFQFADSLDLFRALDPGVTGGCVKLQCLVRSLGAEERLRAHRALDDAIALRGAVRCAAEALGVSSCELLRSFALEVDVGASLAELYTLIDAPPARTATAEER